MATGSCPDPAAPPAHVANADYIGSTWRLTSVTDGATSTAVPAHIDAWMTLNPDGRFLIHDGVNAASGKYTRFADGFEVREVATTAAGYIGTDPHQLAALAGFGAVTAGSRDNDSPSIQDRNLARGVDQTRLVLQAGKLRLTFERTVDSATTTSDTPRPR